MHKIQSHRLKQKYEIDAEFALSMRMLSALAYVPVDRVEEAFEELCQSDIFIPEAQEIINYFQDVWIGRPDRRLGRRLPYFPHKMWNVYKRVRQNASKTNNSVEGWHRGFEEQLTAHHPNIWKFVECIKREQSLSSAKIEEMIAGQDPAPRKKKYRNYA